MNFIRRLKIEWKWEMKISFSLQKKEEPTRAGGRHRDDDNSIDDVDEDKIDEILRDASKNLVIFFCE